MAQTKRARRGHRPDGRRDAAAAQSEKAKQSRANQPDEPTSASQERDGAATGAAASPLGAPTLTWILVILAAVVLLFAGRLAALRVEASGFDSATVTALVIFWLPGLISAALLVGASVGLLGGVWRRRDHHTKAVRLAFGGVAGVLAGLITGGALLASGAGESPVIAGAASLAVAAIVGGLLSAMPLPVLAAGLLGAVAVAVVQLVMALFTPSLRGLLDGTGTGPEVADAHRLLAWLTALLAGVAAGLASYAFLRRLGPVTMLGQLVAGGAAGGFLLIAELITRVAQPLLTAAAGGNTDDPIVLSLAGQARLNTALLVFFAGAVSGLVAYGRSKPAKPKPMNPGKFAATARSSSQPAEPKSSAKTSETRQPTSSGTGKTSSDATESVERDASSDQTAPESAKDSKPGTDDSAEGEASDR